MGKIRKITNSMLFGGTSNEEIYPISSTQAIFSQNSHGEQGKKLEDRLVDIETKAENCPDEPLTHEDIDDIFNNVIGSETDTDIQVITDEEILDLFE